jgi:hypothetical protein
MPIYVDDIKTFLWRSGFIIPIWYTQNKFYDDLLLVFYDAIFIFVIIFRAKSSPLDTYDENGDFFIDDVTKVTSVTSKSSQIATFLVVSQSFCTGFHICQRKKLTHLPLLLRQQATSPIQRVSDMWNDPNALPLSFAMSVWGAMWSSWRGHNVGRSSGMVEGEVVGKV